MGWRDVEFWLSLFPNLTQADLDNPRLFTPNLESMVQPATPVYPSQEYMDKNNIKRK